MLFDTQKEEQRVAKKGELRSLLIGDRKFYARVAAVVLPIIIQNTVSNVVSLLDNVMVGRIGTLPMSAVAIVNQLLFVFNLCIFGGLAGAGIFAAQYAGAGDDRGVRHCFRMKWFLALGMLAVALGIFLAMPERLIAMYLADDTAADVAAETMGYALRYLRIMLVGLIPFTISQVYSSTLRELGETKLPMIASLIAIVLNLVFDYVLIFGSDGLPFLPFGPLGVTGAAIATVFSRFVEAAIIVLFTHTRTARFPFIVGAYRSLRVPASLCRSIAVKGAPLLVNEFLWSSGEALLMQCYSVRGLDVVAATTICSTVSSLFNIVFLSMGNSLAILVGQHLGANELDKAKSTAWRILTLEIVLSFVIGAIMFVVTPAIPRIYNTTDAVRAMAASLLRVMALMTPFLTFAAGAYFTLRAGGKTLITMFFDCGFSWCASLPVAYLLAHYTTMPIVPLYACVLGLNAIKCIIGFALVKKGVWLNNMVQE
jgi:putative MATE family efflux protein